MRSILAAAAAALVVAVYAVPVSADATADFQKLARDYWQSTLEANPRTATSVGDRRYDDRLEDHSRAGHRREEERLRDVLARARAIDVGALSAENRRHHQALIEIVEGDLLESECRLEEWVVDPMRGPQVWVFNLPAITSIDSPEQGARYVKRLEAFEKWMAQHVENLEYGLAHGRVSNQDAVRKSIEALDAVLAQPTDSWEVTAPGRAPHADWSERDRTRFARDLADVAEKRIRPALARYRTFLDERIRPAARSQEAAGLAALEGGVECYRKMIRAQTSLDLTPEEVHRLGLEHVAKFRADLAELGGRVLGTSDITEIQKKLREDPAMHFASAAEVQAKAQESLDRARAAIPAWFGILPKAPCEVAVIGMHEAPNSTIAYYRRPAIDGSRPGYYMINTYLPGTRPRYEAEALAFHESIPGHHLQIAIAQELDDLPAFRKAQGVTAFVEGWALYTERLADDMGLYSGDLDRIGMLSYDAWRSCRLVVDTGLHAFGWSRQRAIDYMLENSLLAGNNIVNEVDRYLARPAQALAYKTGQIEILRLREEARDRLGERFDIRAFHDAVLGRGSVSLAMLREQVEAWIAGAELASP